MRKRTNVNTFLPGAVRVVSTTWSVRVGTASQVSPDLRSKRRGTCCKQRLRSCTRPHKTRACGDTRGMTGVVPRRFLCNPISPEWVPSVLVVNIARNTLNSSACFVLESERNFLTSRVWSPTTRCELTRERRRSHKTNFCGKHYVCVCLKLSRCCY